MSYSMKNGVWQKIGVALLTVGLALLTFQTLRMAIATPPSFDGSMNLEVARSLSQGDGYRRLYAEQQPFPHEIQTNAPYILPAAAAFNTLGIGIAQSELINCIYLLALMLLSALLARKIGGWYLSIFCSALVFATPGLLEFGFEGYGEIPALTWFIAAVVVYFNTEEHRAGLWRSAVCGLCLALAVLTKTVMLMCVAGFALCVLLQATFHREGSIKRILYSLLAMLAGALSPIIAFETWKEVGLGGRHAWHDWWHYEGHAILFQAGVQHNASHSLSALAEKVWLHLHILAHVCQLPLWLTMAWALLVLTASFVTVVLAIRDKRLLGVATILCVAALYFIWWLAITPDAKAWLRRIFDGIICANLGLTMFAGHLLGRRRGKVCIYRLAEIVVLSSVPILLLVMGTDSILAATPPDNTKLLQMTQKVKNLPKNAYLFGIGWDSSPLISLLSGRHFVDFNDVPNGGLDVHRPMYLIRTRGLPSTQRINETFSIYGFRLRALSTGVDTGNSQAAGDSQITAASTAVYRLPELHPVPIHLDKGSVLSLIQYSDNYPYIRGPYPAEPGNGRWFRTDNIVVLQPTSSGVFFLHAYAVPQKHFKYPHPVEAEISFNGCLTPPQAIPTGTAFTIEIHALQYCKLDPNEPWTVRIQVNNVVESGLTNDERELSLLFKSMGFH